MRRNRRLTRSFSGRVANLAQRIEPAQLLRRNLSGCQPSSCRLEQKPHLRDVLNVANGDRCNYVSAPWNGPQKSGLAQSQQSGSDGRFPHRVATGELTLCDLLSRFQHAPDNVLLDPAEGDPVELRLAGLRLRR